MRRVEHLLTAIRRPTDNLTEVTDTAGLNDDELIENLNDAQAYLQQTLEPINDNAFIRETFIDSVANQEAYTLPTRCYLDQNLKMVEYSTVGLSQLESYRKLRHVTLFERRTVRGGFYPSYYTIRNRQILLSPIPNASISNALRINFVQQLPALSKRRAKITAVTVVSGEITALTVDITDFADYFAGAEAFSESNILVDDLFCIVDSSGTIMARNIPITAISPTTGVATITSYTPESSLETADINQYLVAGANATTHCELPLACEPFLITWGKQAVLERDKMFQEASKMQNRLVKMEEGLMGAWNRISNDVQYIPILNSDYLFA